MKIFKSLGYRYAFPCMSLFFAGSLATIATASPAQAFSFSQGGYSGSVFLRYPLSPPGTPDSITFSNGTLNGSFDGSDQNNDGQITCRVSSGCEVTSLSFILTADGFGDLDKVASNPPNPTLSFSYTLGNPTSLNFGYSFQPGFLSSVSTGGSGGSFNLVGLYRDTPLTFSSGSSSSPLLVSRDPAAVPEPSGVVGLLLAGGAGAWLKRRRQNQVKASPSVMIGTRLSQQSSSSPS
jgi:hypothetical protein